MPAEYTDRIETTIEYIDNERINKGLRPIDRYEVLSVYPTAQDLQDDLVTKTKLEILELYLYVAENGTTEDFDKIKEGTRLNLYSKKAYFNLQKMIEKERAKAAEEGNIKG